jgi:hypothetical protein
MGEAQVEVTVTALIPATLVARAEALMGTALLHETIRAAVQIAVSRWEMENVHHRMTREEGLHVANRLLLRELRDHGWTPEAGWPSETTRPSSP